MDWTGGARRRYATKGKSNAVLHKQKAHFAKVQAQKQHPFETPDFIRDAIASRSHQPVMSSSRHPATQQSMEYRSEPSTSHHKRRAVDETLSNKRHRMSNELDGEASASRSSGRYGADRTGTKHGKAMPAVPPPPPPPTTTTDEDRLLLANRERLLARNDWLGLSAARPLRMEFAAARDRENVGKRRRVRKSKDQKAKPARQRSHTPLFRHDLRPRNDCRSNAEPDLDMHIRIGTDAFATQTQTSRRSHTPANTSMRQPSTELGPISEESMLLGVDGDGFELKTDHAAPLQNIHEPDLRIHTDFTGPSYDFAAPTATMAPSFQLSQDSEPVSTMIYQDPEHGHPAAVYSNHHLFAKQEHQSDRDDAYQERVDDLKGEESHAFNVRAAGRTPEQMDSDDDDDETFRTLMKADAALSGKSSVAAIASSSHGASIHSAPFAILQPQYATKPLRGRQGRGSLVLRSDSLVAERSTMKSEQYGPTEAATSVALGSPSTSLRRLYRTTSRPTELVQMPADPPPEDEDDDEAVWRSIYVRSQGSDSTTSGLAETVQKTWVRKSDDIIEPAAYSSSCNTAAEKVQSDKATFGGSFLGGYQSSDQHSPRNEEAENESSQPQTNTSMIGHATTTALEADDIEDDDNQDFPYPHLSTIGNIHMASSISSTHRNTRFRRNKQPTRPSIKEPPRFDPLRARGARQEISTYVN